LRGSLQSPGMGRKHEAPGRRNVKTSPVGRLERGAAFINKEESNQKTYLALEPTQGKRQDWGGTGETHLSSPKTKGCAS